MNLRIVTCCLAGSAAFAAIPLAATAQSLTITSPTSGATLSGSTNPCGASVPSGTSYVRFYRDGSWMNTDTASPYSCNIDASRLSTGTHKLKAVSYNNYNSVNGQAEISFNVGTTSTSTGGTGTSTGGTTGSTTIASSDIVNLAQGGVPFAQQSGYNTQCLGQYLYATDIPETGMTYTVLSNGETIRLGKYADPRDSTRKVLVHQVDPKDPTTSGAKRCEIKFPNNIQLNHTYWAAFSVYAYDWGTLSSSDNALFGLQQHNGSPLDLSPNFAVYTYGDGRSFQIHARGSSSSSPSYSNTTTVRSTPQPIPFGRWSNFVFKFKLDPYGNGFLQVWQDGTKIFDFRGTLGYVTPGYTDFFKFGYYNWSGSNFASTRKVLLRSPVIVSDPTGSTYTPDQLRSFVNAH